jgi:hypothetical protein
MISIVGEIARVCPASDELCARGEFRVVAVEYYWRRERGYLYIKASRIGIACALDLGIGRVT